MSTPVSIEAPVAARIRTDSEQERDLQRRMQDMIDLQNQQQHMSEHGSLGTQEEFKHTGLTTISSHQQRSLSLSKHTAAGAKSMAGGSEEEPLVDKDSSTPYNSVRNDMNDSTPLNQHGVGKGTLYFSNNYQSTFSDCNGVESPYNTYLPKPALPEGGRGSDLLQQSPISVPHYELQQPQLNSSLGYDTGYGSIAHPAQQEHEWYYGNPDYLDGITTQSRTSQDRSFLSSFCCILQPLLNILNMQLPKRLPAASSGTA